MRRMHNIFTKLSQPSSSPFPAKKHIAMEGPKWVI